MSAPVVSSAGALTGGMGRKVASAFARIGNRVVVSGRKEDAGKASVTQLRALDAEAEFVRDVRSEENVRLPFPAIISAGRG